MRTPRRAARLTTALAAALALSWAVPVPAGAGPGFSYAALGDSFSSGLGAHDYDLSSGRCFRSPHAYGPRWAAAHHVTDFRFAACAGATSHDLLIRQLPSLRPDTDLVTLTLGGNDVDYGRVMPACSIGPSTTCEAETDRAERLMDHTLPARLDAAYAAVARRAPHARVIVLGYPHLFGDAPCLVPAPPRARRMDAALNHLDAVIADRARAAGFAYVDARGRFAGHGACSGRPWINPAGLAVWESYHPNGDGYLGYASLLP
ncbi:SGNH/GDSL hydrolase family protein [Streptomyces sp. AV19]|uniref:SGNH/GDSL hydrolase family protein n=1 Tax=Streptomyces sp. AV19 TaxID=2793068 RepID=UPI0018FE7D03|nr:SGNH/GDSL hydrolase family protein [Streptomyces sp. AV19]MBH1938244.1 SGNH/GDSL hydrolase family protein [Streptomyces sp. AV19]MDG4534874.1 SGNH/GDSL hydrolase family protein [Streptomyces sp. AV19]